MHFLIQFFPAVGNTSATFQKGQDFPKKKMPGRRPMPRGGTGKAPGRDTGMMPQSGSQTEVQVFSFCGGDTPAAMCCIYTRP